MINFEGETLLKVILDIYMCTKLYMHVSMETLFISNVARGVSMRLEYTSDTFDGNMVC